MGVSVAIVGATGAVGREFISCLVARQFPVGELRLFASPQSVGQKVTTPFGEARIETLEEGALPSSDLFLFSAGKEVSKYWIPRILRSTRGVVIDNSSAFRREKDVPLVVPSVNIEAVGREGRLIANPNCSTIQMVMAIHPLWRIRPPNSIVVTSIQSVSGSGGRSITGLHNEMSRAMGLASTPANFYPVPILGNAYPLIGAILPNGFSEEEDKMTFETRKILSAPELHVAATCIRVPVERGHSGAASLRFDQPLDLAQCVEAIRQDPRLHYCPEPDKPPTPRFLPDPTQVAVGRLRCDGPWVHLWEVADNLWIGAALNAVDIAQRLLDMGRLPRASA